MRVAHLEIDSVRGYYRKVSVHAKSIREFGHLAPLRALGFKERLMVFNQMAQSEGYNVFTAITVFLVLTVGLAYWMVGAARGLWARSTRPQLGKPPQPGS
jgi:hypothetical protein